MFIKLVNSYDCLSIGFIFSYIFKNITDNLKYTRRAAVSTIVVINGLAIIAGSIFKDFAIKGNTPPITFAITTVTNKLIPTTRAVSILAVVK